MIIVSLSVHVCMCVCFFLFRHQYLDIGQTVLQKALLNGRYITSIHVGHQEPKKIDHKPRDAFGSAVDDINSNCGAWKYVIQRFRPINKLRSPLRIPLMKH